MTITIKLPAPIEESLREAATIQRISPEELAAQILEEAFQLELFETLEQVVERAKRLPRNPDNIRPATASLKELLEDAPVDPEFDLTAWQRDWQKVEKEMKEISRANTIAEGFIPPQ
ncbi:MAG: hypothetical protein LC131_12280 [Anaerolineae bacterium]|nr:hypothetical protein [Anaerolineae bacterium]